MNNANNITNILSPTNFDSTEPRRIVQGQVPTTDVQVPHLRLVPGALSENATERPTRQKPVLIQQVDLVTIRTDGDIRARIDVNPLVTAEYAQLMREGVLFLPITVFFDGNEYWLADGFYRFAAAKQVGRDKIGAVVHHGSQRSAKLFAINANKAHGERYTTRDKRHAIVTLLKDAEWNTWSNYQIANQCGATEGTVRKYRREVESLLSTTEDTQMRNCLRNGKALTMNIGRLRAKRAAHAEPVISPEVVEMTHDLPFTDDAAQVSKLSTLPLDEQLEVVEIIANAQSVGHIRSVAEAILELKRQRQNNKKQADLQSRVDEALLAGYDDGFVLGNCAQALLGLEPQSVKLLLADGPYGIGFSSSGHASTDRITHDKTPKEALDIHRQMLEAIDKAMMPDSHVMLFCDKKLEPEFRQMLCVAGYEFKDSLIWDKGDAGRPILNQSSRRHERIIWFTKGNPQITGNIADVLCHPRANRCSGEPVTDHLTPKPLGLMTELIQAATLPGEQVVDPFAGSASTLVAAKMLGRRYFGVELNTKWHAQGTARLNRASAEMMGATAGESTPNEVSVAEAVVAGAAVAEVTVQSLPDVTTFSNPVEAPLSATTYQATVPAVA